MNKRENGVYYTVNNPFKHKEFVKWYNKATEDTKIILEPFAGGNNIPRLVNETGVDKLNWLSYDITPTHKNVIQRDTIKDFPTGYKTIITNPPYLDKSSATYNKLSFPDTIYNNVYKHCLDIMLHNSDYIAAIIPDPFITDKDLKERLHTVISINENIFTDTEQPVCLALFTPNKTDDYIIYVKDERVGYNKDVEKFIPNAPKQEWKFNDVNGTIHLKAVDNKIDKMRFMLTSERVPKPSDRMYTTISTPNDIKDVETFINICNDVLNDFRYNTRDVLMTSYRGLRHDGFNRKRLSYNMARKILDKAYEIYIKGE